MRLILSSIFFFIFFTISVSVNSNEFEVIVICVSHSYYKNLNFMEWISSFKGLLIDSTKLFSTKEINKFKDNGINYKSLGRGDL